MGYPGAQIHSKHSKIQHLLSIVKSVGGIGPVMRFSCKPDRIPSMTTFVKPRFDKNICRGQNCPPTVSEMVLLSPASSVVPKPSSLSELGGGQHSGSTGG